MKKVRPPPPAATCLAIHSRDDGIVAIGMDNSTIVTRKLEGHSKRVTSLPFSNTLNVQVSSEFCVGKTEMQIVADSRWEGVEIIVRYIQIHQNELHLLAINKTHLAVYEVKALACVKAYQGLFGEPFGFLILHIGIKNKRHPKRDQATQ
ncbi:unnamed protein product [Prunus armeniaca]